MPILIKTISARPWSAFAFIFLCLSLGLSGLAAYASDEQNGGTETAEITPATTAVADRSTLTTAPALKSAASAVTEPSLWRLLLALLFVLAMIFVAAWLIRRSPLRNMHGAIKVVSSLSLGAREKLVLVQVGDQQMLLGVTPSQINLLQALPQPVLAEAVSAPPKFADALALVLKGNRS